MHFDVVSTFETGWGPAKSVVHVLIDDCVIPIFSGENRLFPVLGPHACQMMERQGSSDVT